MKRKGIFILLAFWLLACNEEPKGNNLNPSTEPNIESDSKYNSINLRINNPTVLDSSDWIIYPLTLEELEETEEGFESSSYGRSAAYWNVAFYNTETKESRLLSDNLKMLINTISPKNESIIQSGQQKAVNQGQIFYSIIIDDFNQDGKLNSDDPEYLFISDLSGEGFKQVSPKNFELIYWQSIVTTNKVLIQARQDINQDQKFDSEDEIVSLIYNTDTHKLEQVFDAEFNLKTKKLLDNQWTKKK
tara:strand:- start:39 stop:776 length:738 start_codon:yes stop_codon:yes gene_type:complete